MITHSLSHVVGQLCALDRGKRYREALHYAEQCCARTIKKYTYEKKYIKRIKNNKYIYIYKQYTEQYTENNMNSIKKKY